MHAFCFKFISNFCVDGAHYTSAWKRCSQLTSYDRDNCKTFIEHGGVEFKTIPCLNDSDEWAEVLSMWIKQWS